ncbi:MAG: hypothetical protein M1830_004382, partial [Pleopsidium flavum]
PREATPHHLVFIADPQLVDPHTYPDRPWPLSTFTVRHTDLYLRRSFSLLQRKLHPDTVFFLGDLFDGGREWATDRSESSEKQWRKYGEKFWLREYNRFGRIFFDHWGDGGLDSGAGQQGRKIIASLPGNHDLGLGAGIQIPVRNRFNAYFGDGNRVDVIANHTFVSVDTVSLSAMDQPDPATGSQGSGLGAGEGANSAIWMPVQEFLDHAKDELSRAVERQIRWLNNQTNRRLEHTVTELEGVIAEAPPTRRDGVSNLPTILLTHVPLYRRPGTPCGPHREHLPPSKPSSGESEPLSVDEPNAIAVRAGYQYQNVLTPTISKYLIEKIGDVGYVFSGDDHDYCEVVHHEYTASSTGSGIREITVKSMSWAMGVRKPGFLMLSLWNPIDGAGKPVGNHGGAGGRTGPTTMETHLCLLPDQLGIFISYASLLGFTFITLVVTSVLKATNRRSPSDCFAGYSDDPLLPIARSSQHRGSSAENEKAEALYQRRRADSQKSSDGSQSSNSSSSSNNGGLAVRSSAARTRSVSPSLGYGIPVSQIGGTPQAGLGIKFAPLDSGAIVDSERGDQARVGTVGSSRERRRPKQGLRARVDETLWSMWRVGWIAMLWYTWLVWHG